MIKVRNVNVNSYLMDIEDFEHTSDAPSEANYNLSIYIENDCLENEEFLELKVTPIGDKVLITVVTVCR